MFTIWLFSLVSYWSGWSDLGALLLLLASGYKVFFYPRATKFWLGSFSLILFMMFSYVYGVFSYPPSGKESATYVSLIHFVVLILSLNIISPKLEQKSLIWFSLIFSLGSIACAIFGYFWFTNYFYFMTASGALRYELYFSSQVILLFFPLLYSICNYSIP